MQTALKQTVTVQEGGLIEVRSPQLPVGARAEVIILLEEPVVDYSEEWTEADLNDFNHAGWELIHQRLEAEENG
jgi:hypothetical protein